MQWDAICKQYCENGRIDEKEEQNTRLLNFHTIKVPTLILVQIKFAINFMIFCVSNN